MTRALRIQYTNACYHVMNRGIAKQSIYDHDEHRYDFLSLLQDINLRYQIEIHAYCLMGNHYHLLLKTPAANLDRAMRHLNSVYTQRYNRSAKKDGPLFRGRYRACLIEAENYLLQVSRYIHLNPVAAKISQKPEGYYWSSYRYFIGLDSAPSWLTLTDTLQFLNENNPYEEYRLFVECFDEVEDGEVKLHQKNKMMLLGSDSFIKVVTEQFFQKKHQIAEIPAHKKLPLFPELKYIQLTVMHFFNISQSELLTGIPRITNWPKLIMLYLAVKLTSEHAAIIGRGCGDISGSAVGHAYRKVRDRIRVDDQLANSISVIEKMINSGFQT